MFKSVVVLLAVVLVLAWAAGCNDDSPSDPGGGGGTANRAPGAPTIDTGAGAPGDGTTDQAITSTLHWACSDPDGDALTFDVFFGLAADPPSVATGQSGESHSPGTLAHSTQYYWKIVAEDPDGETTSSAVWSFTTAAPGAETVSTPTTPTGPTTGDTGASLSFTSGLATSSEGHSIEYRFDWGGGDYSTWSASPTASHSWASAGINSVKAQARCASHNAIVSSWSGGLAVDISDAVETVSTPVTPAGAVNGDLNVVYNYTAAGANSSAGHTVEYRFDWGGGGADYSNWSASTTVGHSWASAGTYTVKAQARCATHPTVESLWSAGLDVTISAPSELISTPYWDIFPTVGGVGADLGFYCNGGSSTAGHPTEHQYEWGNGITSDWQLRTVGLRTYAYPAAGSFDVRCRARCAEHTAIVTDWSGPVTVVISDTETISAPTTSPSGEATREAGWAVTVMQLATSSFGHTVEYYIEWGDGEIRDWSTSNSPNHSYPSAGDYEVRSQARCQDHPAIVSDWSEILTLHITEGISNPTAGGPATGTVGVEATFTATDAVSSEGHALEYRVLTSQYDYRGPYTAQPWGTLSYTFNSASRWYIKVQARCIDHPDAESSQSYFHRIDISN